MGQPVVFIGTYLIHVFVKSTFYTFLSSGKLLKISQEHHLSVKGVQIVNKGYQQTTKVAVSMERVFPCTVQVDISQGNRKNGSRKMGLCL